MIDAKYRIMVSVFFAFFAKIMLDLFAVTTILINIREVDFLRTIVYTCFIGIVVMYVYNQIHRRYLFSYSIVFVFALLLVQYALFFGYPKVFEYPYFNTTLVGFVFVGNILLLRLFDSIKIRTNFDNSSHILNYAKVAGIIFAGITTLVLYSKYELLYVNTYYTVSFFAFIISLILIVSSVLRNTNYNAIIENIQEVRIENRVTKLLTNKYFISLLLAAFLIGAIIYLSFRLFSLNLLEVPLDISLIEILSFYAISTGVLGALLEKYFKKKLLIHIGVKGVLFILPIIVLIIGVFFLMYYYFPVLKQNRDWIFLFFIGVIMFLGILHISFEYIVWPSVYNLYQPINISTRIDFYNKSFVFGLLLGICIIGYINYNYVIKFEYEIQLLSFAIIIVGVLNLLINQFPLYKHYRLALQNYLDNQSEKIVRSKSLFKNIESYKRYKGIQFVRFINLLNIINPLISRKAISETINSDDYFCQRFSIGKAADFIMLELQGDLDKIKSDKYFFASPNRDMVMYLIGRFNEIRSRMSDDIYYIDQLAISKKNNERVLGATLAYYCSGEIKERIIKRLLNDSESYVIYKAIVSSQEYNNDCIIEALVDKLDDQSVGNAALSTLLSCGEHIVKKLEKAFYKTGQTEKTQLRIIQLYGEIATVDCVEYLIKNLNSSNQNIINASLFALSKCKLNLPEEKIILLYHEVEELCEVLVWNMSMLLDIENKHKDSLLVSAMKTEIEGNYSNLFNLLSLLYDSKSISLIQINLFSGDADQVAFALELASVLFKGNTKHLLIPILQPVSNSEKVHMLRSTIPTESLKVSEIYEILILRDSKWINQWTKACAISELAKLDGVNYKELFVANMINDDSMLRELSSKSLYNMDKEFYLRNKEDLGVKYVSLFSADVLSFIESDDTLAQSVPLLKYDIITFLQTIPEFSDITGEVLKQITNYIKTVSVKRDEVVETLYNGSINNYFYVLYSGEVSVYIGNIEVKRYKDSCFISSLEVADINSSIIRIVCKNDAVMYRISPSELMELFTIRESVPESFVKHTDNNKLTEYGYFLKEDKVKNIVEKHDALV